MKEAGNAQEPARLLVALASEAGVEITAGSASLMLRHLALVYETNAHTNLTRVPEDDAVALHVLDSLTGLAEMLRGPDGPWLDIGSGAGFPGVPLGLAGGRHVDLLESVRRKAEFLDRVVGELRLDATVRLARAEDAALELGGAFAAVGARAVSDLAALVELASPLLMQGGLLVCWKGDPSWDELDRGARAAARAGMRHVRTAIVSIPGVDARRSLVVYERSGAAAVKLPRRVGLAQSTPLA